jgi:xylulokinase
MSDPLFLGLDLSTQQLKAILLSASSNIVKEAAVHFDDDLPQYNTTNGALHGDTTSGREGVVAAPVAMFLDALDMLMDKLKGDGVDFSLVKAVGGSAQVFISMHAISLSSQDESTSSNTDQFTGVNPPIHPSKI